MARVEKSIEVNAPLHTVYNQWTQFEEFPNFMEGIQEVRQLDDTHLHWHANIGGKDVEWRAEITEQIPDQRVAWRSTDGPRNAGTVDFHRVADDRTLVSVIMEYEPEGLVENVGSAFGMFSRRVDGDLERFKEFIESRGRETGAWRGEVRRRETAGTHAAGSQGRQTGSGYGVQRSQRGQTGMPSLPGLFGSWSDPFSHMRRMSEEMDILFERLMGLPMRRSAPTQGMSDMWVPQVELTQKGDELVVHADLPGVKKEDVQVEIAEGRLIVQGERRTSSEHTEGGMHRSECSYGHFYREIPLPDEADGNEAHASMKDGVLEVRVRLPHQARRSRRLEIETAPESRATEPSESAPAQQQAEQRRQNLPL